MKKLIPLVFVSVCALVLIGCNNRSMDYIIANEPNIPGIVKDINENFIIIENENGEYCVSLNVESEDSMTNFNKGDEVIVYFDGYIAESYPIADDTIYNYIQNFIDGKISRAAFWKLVKFKYPMHQISFHTISALDTLRFVGSEVAYGK